MALQTAFRPQLHGFDFHNLWDLDENYANFVRSIVEDSVPLAVKAVVTDPAILAALLGIGGIAIGVAEALIPGFDLIVAGLVGEFLTKTKDVLKDLNFQSYGLCGGMAYTSVDYFTEGWVIPKGVCQNGKLDCPPLNTASAVVLRNYIFGRFEDSWKSGGVMNEMLEWYILLNLMPTKVGGGGKALQKKTKPEWTAITTLLDQGQPWPIALIFDSWNIFDNHQVVAYGYDGDPETGLAHLHIYDNNNPDIEARIEFTFTGSQLEGAMQSSDGQPLQDYQTLKGFFHSKYTPKTPPVGWGLQFGLNSLPARCGGANFPFTFEYTAGNAFDCFEAIPGSDLQAVLVPVIADVADIAVLPSNFETVQDTPVFEHTQLKLTAQRPFGSPGTYTIFSKVWLAFRDETTNAVSKDIDGQLLETFLLLPPSAIRTQDSVQLNIFPDVRIEPFPVLVCQPSFVQGQPVSLRAVGDPFGADPVAYEWAISGVAATDTNQQVVKIPLLPQAGTEIVAKVVVTDTVTGCTTIGAEIFFVISAAEAAQQQNLCLINLLANKLAKMEHPRGPEDLQAIQQTGTEIAALAGALLAGGAIQ